MAHDYTNVNMITLHYLIESGDKRYRVTRRDAHTGTMWDCECPDHAYRGGTKQCKHITAARTELRSGWIGTEREPRVTRLKPNQGAAKNGKHNHDR